MSLRVRVATAPRAAGRGGSNYASPCRGASPPPLVDQVTRVIGDVLHAASAVGQSSRYALDMWRQALDANMYPGADADSLLFPYVPIAPEAHGVSLTPSSAVLDVGCLAGHGLFDFWARRQRLAVPVPQLVGLDVDADGLALGRTLIGVWSRHVRAKIVQGTCEAMPFAAGAFDLVVARSVLQYVGFEATLHEIARVLRSGGLAVVQVHAPGYYSHKLRQNAIRLQAACYYVRPLLSSIAFALTRRQPTTRWFRETALGLGQLTRLAGRHDLLPVWTRRHPRRPLVVLRRC